MDDVFVTNYWIVPCLNIRIVQYLEIKLSLMAKNLKYIFCLFPEPYLLIVQPGFMTNV